MPLNLTRLAQQLVSRSLPVDEFGEPQSRNSGRGAAPQSASERDLAAHIDDQRWKSALRRPKILECLFDPIRTAEWPARETTFQPSASIVHEGRDAHSKIQADGNAKRVEPWAEIRDRRGNGDLRSYALHSPSMTSGLNA